MLEVRWLGCAGLELEINSKVILIDPYLSRPGIFKILFSRIAPAPDLVNSFTSRLAGRVSAVICGHTHFDHVLDVPEIVRSLGCRAVGSSSLKALLDISGVSAEVTICSGNERIDLDDDIRVQMIPSRHGRVFLGRTPYPGEIDPSWTLPLKASQYRLGAMFMPKIEVGDITLIHSGSAGFIESELDGHRCDVLFMCVPGWKSMPEYTTRMVNILRPEVIIPFHFDDFTRRMPRSGRIRMLPSIDLQGFVERVHKYSPGAVIRIPKTNEVMRF
ncbi:MAG TPA: MBL fold metallo-hydrolase [Deltaproteobacteria bacterium]|nr:MBL fold metallo-hydrolase [Deltaproteobacteria bacterium]